MRRALVGVVALSVGAVVAGGAADYVLPSKNLRISGAGVFWPRSSDPLFRLVGVFPFRSSDRRAVWVDVRVPGPDRTRARRAVVATPWSAQRRLVAGWSAPDGALHRCTASSPST